MDGKRRPPPDWRFDGGEQEPSRAAATATDRLRNLPEEVLLSILSRVPVREVVRMSALSRRWGPVLSLLPVLDELDLSSPTAENNFDLADYWGLIRRCVFSSFETGERFDRWAEAIASKGVQELECVENRALDIYPILHHCRSLAVLKLVFCRLITGRPQESPPPNIRSTGLREVDLQAVDIHGDLLQVLISTCPAIETLRMWDCNEVGDLRICGAPSLRSLEFGYHGPYLGPIQIECEVIVVEAPNLESLFVGMIAWWCEEFTIRCPKLTSLRLHLIEGAEGLLEDEWEEDGPPCRLVAEALRRLLEDAAHFRSLHLSGTSIRCLSKEMPPEKYRPPFVSLTQMDMEVSLQDRRQIQCMVALLQRCSCLRVFNLFVSTLESAGDPVNPRVPSHPLLLFLEHQETLEKMGCLRHHLKEVTIYGVTGDTYEMKLACFFLMEARALQKLSLKFWMENVAARDLIAKQLPKLRRGSPAVELEFDLMQYMIY